MKFFQILFIVLAVSINGYLSSAYADNASTNNTLTDSAYQVDESVSTLSFATIKLQYVVEPAVINNVSGGIDKRGNFSIVAPIQNINTGVAIRDERLNNTFFESASFPKIEVTGKVPNELLSSTTTIKQQIIPASIALFGKTKKVDLLANIVNVGDTIVVSSAKPNVISASDFGIPAANLTRLAEFVGGISIANAAPVSFSIVFHKAK